MVEDHCEVLDIWRRAKCLDLDLVHLDAHIDFGVYEAQPLEEAILQAKSVKDLKARLESSLAFQSFEKDFDTQLNIGNYVYSAMREGIVRDFYWVVPGSIEGFQKYLKAIKRILKNIAGKELETKKARPGFLSFSFLGRNFVVCCLGALPYLKHEVLLDIDVDFLVMKNITQDCPTKNIGKRKPWIAPDKLVEILSSKVPAAEMITISYSVNGGWTPIKYKYLGDELAYYFNPMRLPAGQAGDRKWLEKKLKAARYFSLFQEYGKKEDYQKAVQLDQSYRAEDNNFGPLYAMKRKFGLARKEFQKILNADPLSPAALVGLGEIALEKKEFRRARSLFSRGYRLAGRNKLFSVVKNRSLLQTGVAEFRLKDFKAAQKYLTAGIRCSPLEPYPYSLLGDVAYREKRFLDAYRFYKDAMCLGFNARLGLLKLFKISLKLCDRRDIIDFIQGKYRKNLKLKYKYAQWLCAVGMEDKRK